MRNIAGLLLLVVAACSARGLQEWSQFKEEFNKHYDNPQEEQFRMETFYKNLDSIKLHNMNYQLGLSTFTLGVNHLSDLTDVEYADYISCLNGTPKESRPAVDFKTNGSEAPDEVDWRKQGAVTRVKNQGKCGSCWAFSTTGSLEGHQFLNSGNLVELSEQNLVDCSTKQGNLGCNGGYMWWAFNYILENGGIDTEAAYPYEAVDGKCRFDPNKVGAKISGYVNVTAFDNNALKEAVAKGPVSVAIDASHSGFRSYRSGIYYDKGCKRYTINHGVLIVGYGTDPGKGDYWIVKNSWGKKWGNGGYILMARNRDIDCGITSTASYPIVTTF